jgi:LysM repeat protein
VTVIAAGDIAKCNLEWDTYTAALLDVLPGTILTLGDNTYVQGTLQEFNECFGPTWGRHKDRIYPVPGNHEYLTGGAEGYFTYFGDRATPLELGCRKECKGYYSFNLGAWHIVALNSEISIDPGSEQDQWLRADLAAHPNVCTLAYWHKPRWSSGRHGSGASAPLFQAAYDYGVDIVLNGHDHDYERFAPQSPQGVLEWDRGVRQFVVGTGGDTQRGFEEDPPNSEVRHSDTWGVLKLTLHPTSYDWEFIPIAGQTFTDSGSGNCVTFGSAPTTSVGAQPVLVSTADAGAGPAAVGNIPAVEVSADLEAVTDTGDTAAAPAAAATLPAEGLDYVVQAGDTLSLIAMRYGLDWMEVARINGITNTEVIEIGQVIRLPGVSEASAVTPVASPAAAAPAATGAASAAGAAAAAATSGITYTVQAGDTLFGIALQANVTLQALLTANNMQEDDFLQIGQVLVIPGRTAPLRAAGTTAAPAAAPAAAAQSPALTGTLPLTATGATTRTTIAATGGVTTTRPVTATAPTLLPTPTAGAAVTTTAAVTTAATAGGPSVHTVAEGDTIITIALQYDLDWQELLALNGLGADTILQIGQQIRLR